jgi:hypothetical protein
MVKQVVDRRGRHVEQLHGLRIHVEVHARVIPIFPNVIAKVTRLTQDPQGRLRSAAVPAYRVAGPSQLASDVWPCQNP